MRVASVPEPAVEGVYGLLLVGTQTGACCWWTPGRRLSGRRPCGPVTTAALVWVGRPVLVVSDGVAVDDVPRVAASLREGLGEALPLVFGQGSGGLVADAGGAPARSLALAEAYARVQLSWAEDEVTVELGGEVHRFGVTLVPSGGGRHRPVLRPLAPGGRR